MAPLLQIAVASHQPASCSTRRTCRGGRAVTTTTRAPPDRASSRAWTVRGETVPSLRSSVPSKSIATTCGRLPPEVMGTCITARVRDTDSARPFCPGNFGTHAHAADRAVQPMCGWPTEVAVDSSCAHPRRCDRHDACSSCCGCSADGDVRYRPPSDTPHARRGISSPLRGLRGRSLSDGRWPRCQRLRADAAHAVRRPPWLLAHPWWHRRHDLEPTSTPRSQVASLRLIWQLIRQKSIEPMRPLIRGAS